MLSQLLAVFGFFSLILVAVYWVNRAVALFDQIIGSGQSALVFLELSALTLPNVIRIVLPLSAFAGAVYVTNRLATESELVVVQATGFSPWRLARPVLVYGIVVAAIMSVLVHWLVPASRAQYAERQAEIAESVTTQLLREGRFLHPTDDITFYIREITPNGEMLDVFLSDSRNPRETVFYTASRSLFVRSDTGPKLIMLDGMAQTLDLASRRLSVTGFADLTYDVGSLITVRDAETTDVRALSTRRLIAPGEERIARTPQGTMAPFRQELHARIATPLLAPVAAMIGFAALLLGAFSRFGLWRQVMGAVLLLIVVQFLDNAATNVARRGPEMWFANYIPALTGMGMAAAMLWWAGRSRRVRPRHGSAPAVPAPEGAA